MKNIRLSKSVLSIEEAKSVENIIMNDGYLGMGKEVLLFEQNIGVMLGRDIVAVNSGTAALHLAIESIISPGDEVLVPTITYVATFQAVCAAGGVPVACDVRDIDMSIDLVDAESKLTNKTKVILPVLYCGNAKAIVEIEHFADIHGLRVVQDAAHAFGSIDREALVGSHGDIVCFSFDGIKNITCGEGGALVSSDPIVLEYSRNARLLGVENDSAKRYRGERSWHFDVKGPGYRYHLSNINAAIGNVQLRRFSEFATKRKHLASLYQKRLALVQGIALFDIDYKLTVPHIFSFLLPPGVEQSDIRTCLASYGVETGVHYFPNHRLTRFKSESNSCPNADKLYKRLLSLPLHPDLEESDVNYVIELIETYLRAFVS